MMIFTDIENAHAERIALKQRLTACLRFASLTQMPSALRKHAKRYPKLIVSPHRLEGKRKSYHPAAVVFSSVSWGVHGKRVKETNKSACLFTIRYKDNIIWRCNNGQEQ